MQFWHSNIQLWFSIMQFWHSNISLCRFGIQIFHYAVLTFKYFIMQFWHSNISLCSFSLCSFENQSSIALLKYAYMITVGTGNWVVIFRYPIMAFQTEFDFRIFISFSCTALLGFTPKTGHWVSCRMNKFTSRLKMKVRISKFSLECRN